MPAVNFIITDKEINSLIEALGVAESSSGWRDPEWDSLLSRLEKIRDDYGGFPNGYGP